MEKITLHPGSHNSRQENITWFTDANWHKVNCDIHQNAPRDQVTTEKLVLHHCPEARSMRALWLIHELNLSVDVVAHAFGDELRTPEYLAIHPLGRVPCLQIGDETIFESGAITQVLCERYDDGSLHRAPDHPERAQWLQWVHYSETMAVHAANLTQQFIALNAPELRSPTVIKLEKRRLEKTLEVVETRLEHRDYLLDSGFSAADISVGYSVHVARLFTDLELFPKTNAYYRRLAARPAFQKSLPANDDPMKFYKSRFYTL